MRGMCGKARELLWQGSCSRPRMQKSRGGGDEARELAAATQGGGMFATQGGGVFATQGGGMF